MLVNLRVSVILVTEYVLHRADVLSFFQLMCCERVPQSVTARRFVNSGCPHCFLYRDLEDVFIDVVTAAYRGAWI